MSSHGLFLGVWAPATCLLLFLAPSCLSDIPPSCRSDIPPSCRCDIPPDCFSDTPPSCLSAIPPRNQTACMARYVVHQCDWGALATISTTSSVIGQPFNSPFSICDDNTTGIPYFYLTDLDISVKDLKANSNVSLTVSLAQTSFCKDQNHDPQNPLCAHVIICGSIQKLSGTEADIAQQALFNRHPEMPTWPKKHNWYCAKLNITNIWVLDNYGEIKTVTPEEYYKAKPE